MHQLETFPGCNKDKEVSIKHLVSLSFDFDLFSLLDYDFDYGFI